MTSFKQGDVVWIYSSLDIRSWGVIISPVSTGTLGCIVRYVANNMRGENYFYWRELQPYNLTVEDITIGLEYELL